MRKKVIFLIFTVIFSLTFMGRAQAKISKKDFHQILDKIENIYSPLVEKASQGLPFVLHRDWDSDIENAKAGRMSKEWELFAYGGFARNKIVDKDTFALLMCHEVGHLVGGLPKIMPTWYSTDYEPGNAAEGQSDYFATSKCMKRLFEKENNQAVIGRLNIPEEIKNKCLEVYGNSNRALICQRSAMAALKLTKFFSDGKVASFRERRSDDEEMPITMTNINVHTPDLLKVEYTNYEEYPSVQCRFDTFFAGALCDKDSFLEPTYLNVLGPDANTWRSDFFDHYTRIEMEDVHQGYCSRAEGYKLGVRPLCWYNPEDEMILDPFSMLEELDFGYDY